MLWICIEKLDGSNGSSSSSAALVLAVLPVGTGGGVSISSVMAVQTRYGVEPYCCTMCLFCKLSSKCNARRHQVRRVGLFTFQLIRVASSRGGGGLRFVSFL